MKSRELTPTRSIAESRSPITAKDLCLVISSKGGVATQALAADSSVIGRSPDADVVIDDGSVSRKHACIRVRDGGVVLEDLGSSNGTSVDGQRVPKGESVHVRVGSCIALGAALVVLQRSVSFIGASAPRVATPDGIVVDSAMQRVYALVSVLGPSPLSVVIHGETGVGKELVARALHAASARARGPLVAINCAAIPETLLESELFGFERGAFTGATHAKPGFFEMADHGTLFLDEIGDMAPSVQARLLRVLETGEVLRIGGTKAHKTDVRVVSATHRDLGSLAAQGSFRADLFYRLNGATLVIPPLRDRVVDIAPIARHFAERIAASARIATPGLGADAIAALERHAWPGNVRELKNAIERAVILRARAGAGPVTAADLALGSAHASAAPSPPSGDLRARVEELERASIVAALERADGNQSEAARALGISRGKLLKRIAAFGLKRPTKRES